MSENEVKKTADKQEKAPLTPEKKRMIVIISVVAVALLLALIPVIVLVVQQLTSDPDSNLPPEVPDDVFEGSYLLDYPGASSVYTFKEGNKVSNKYTISKGVDDEGNPTNEFEVVEVNYTYETTVIDGKNHIILTNEETGEVLTPYEFSYGTITLYRYFCENENCLLNNSGEGTEDVQTQVSEDGHCKSHPDCKVEQRKLYRRYIEISGELYEKIY